MAAINSSLSPAVPNRRRRVRHKIQTPAYASFTAESQGAMLDLHEIVDISEDGIAIQCHSPLEVQKTLSLCLDLAECPQHIYTTGQVIWSNPGGRAGLRFSELPSESLARLREWLFVNVMAGVANGEAEVAAFTAARDEAPPRPGYTDTLAALHAVRRQVEALGSDFGRALQLITERGRSLLRASGVAIALADAETDSMICCASSGSDAPPIGARLQVGSGFSGECVKRAEALRCDDSETDARVDRNSCRALGIRSLLAVPIRVGERAVGLIEGFAPQPGAFSESDATVLQRLADTALEAAHRAARVESLPFLKSAEKETPVPSLGSVLFAAAEADEKEQKAEPDEKSNGGISLPRSHLVILLCAAATIALAMGWGMAPWIQSDATPWLLSKIHSRKADQLPTVLASSDHQKSEALLPSSSSIETTSLDQLMQVALKGDAAAENALGVHYATGQGVALSEVEAIRWFTKAAEQGYIPAQSKLGSLYFSGRGVPQDLNRAYFWMVVARLRGDEASNTLSPSVRARLTRSQATSIELDAVRWLQQHHPVKPAAGQLKIEALGTPHPRPAR
ncbi:MAG TPA: GAF domain-containing protein [Candidatus Sulfotelmatobacter sp.]|nr:GAF domain-containing protein [Candidatus Sulfotelmatobacter sp.]